MRAARHFILLTSFILLARAAGAVANEGQPQPNLPVEQLSIVTGDGQIHVFTVELAVTSQEQDTGLMFRRAVPTDTGMLFVFPQSEIVVFWMKNTVVPLDMVFITSNGVVASVAPNRVPYSLDDVWSGPSVLATLELQGGIAAKYNIRPGDRVLASQFK
jgi:uncharacterized membrane protein (UPF0127 family)